MYYITFSNFILLIILNILMKWRSRLLKVYFNCLKIENILYNLLHTYSDYRKLLRSLLKHIPRIKIRRIRRSVPYSLGDVKIV